MSLGTRTESRFSIKILTLLRAESEDREPPVVAGEHIPTCDTI